MLAAWFAVHLVLVGEDPDSVLLFIDNVAAVQTIAKGGSPSALASKISQAIWRLCASFHTHESATLFVEYVHTAANPADLPSRMGLCANELLIPQVGGSSDRSGEQVGSLACNAWCEALKGEAILFLFGAPKNKFPFP